MQHISVRPINILFVFSTRSMGGMEARAARVARLTKERGHKVAFACLPGSTLDQRLEDYGVTRHPSYIHGSVDLKSCFKLVRLVKRIGAEIIMCFSGKDYWMAILAGRLAGVPVVLNRSTASALRGISVPVASRADRILAVSQGIKQVLVNQGVPTDKVDVIYVGVNTEVFSPQKAGPREQVRERLGIPGDAFLIGCLGRTGKGQEDLLASDPLLTQGPQPVHYFFAGEQIPEALSPFVETGTDLKQRVHLNRLIPHEQIVDILNALDLVVMTPEREPFSNAVLEAMAMEKPLILSATLGNLEAIENDKSGLLVDAHDVEGIAQRIDRVRLKPGLKEKLGQNAGERVRQNFSQQRMLQGLEQVWLESIQAV